MKTAKLSLLVLTLLSAAACVQKPMFQDGFDASILSHYPIVELNGEETAHPYRAELNAGLNTLAVRFDSYRYTYLCRFEWDVKVGQHYEVRHEDFQEPLVLYEWHRINGLWAERMRPNLPECTKTKRE